MPDFKFLSRAFLQINSMVFHFSFQNKNFEVDLNRGIDLSMPLKGDPSNPTAWYCPPPRFEPVMTEHFTGDVKLGGAVNFRDIYFNPHGHGTHTECVGHIAFETYSLRDCMKEFNMMALLCTVSPEHFENGDRIIKVNHLEKYLSALYGIKTLIIRTLPNDNSKLSRQYSNTNPPYFEAEAIQKIVDSGIEHLLVDLPSVDREEDAGALIGHHIFWNYPENPRTNCSITELIYVPDYVEDGIYFLQLGIAAFENDAAPSRPLIYPIVEI